jgi:uncharacterized protein (DUF1015 family)
MSDIRPLRGIRPRPDLVREVASPPYDVLSSDEARQMAAGNQHSFLHVIKAEIDMPATADVHSEALYQLSASNFQKMRDDGIFVADDDPCFYLYQLKMGDHVQKGLVVGASVAEYETGKIKKHELTRKEKEDDRAKHVEIMQANAGPVLFTYKARDEIRDIVQEISVGSDPVYDFTADDGIGHTLWVVSDPADIKRIRDAFEPVDALYIADGHHRSASAFRVRNIMRDKNPNHTGDEEYNYYLAVVFPDDELKIMGYHRALESLNGLSEEEFMAKVEEKFDVEETTKADPDGSHKFGMYLDGKWYQLTAKDGTFSANDPVLSLDCSILQENLLGPVLGIDDPRTAGGIEFIGGIRGTGELERRCNLDMKVAFSVSAVTVEQLMAIADNDEVMPPKSTWFEPKLRSGVVIHDICEQS